MNRLWTITHSACILRIVLKITSLILLFTFCCCESIFDMQSPNIDISQPVDGGSYAGTLPVKIKVTDNYEVAKVLITFGGRTWNDFETGAKKVIIDEVLDIADLDTGEWFLVVEAEDGVGNSSEDDRALWIIIESILHPHKIAGSDSCEACIAYPYSTAGASSNVDHDLQYRFDWDDGSFSDWSSDTSAWHAWENIGTYHLKAQARCAAHTNALSEWSPPYSVAIQPESISTPYAPSGSSNLCSHTLSIYSTRGASSSCGHSLEYRFDWGNGSYSDWSIYRTASFRGALAGSYEIKVQARCATHTNAISEWSPAYVISIYEESISTPSAPSGSSNVVTNTSSTYSTGGAISSCGHSLRYRFDWDDGSYSDWSWHTSADHAWSDAGTYEVKAQVRCASNYTDVLSEWSLPTTVVVMVNTYTDNNGGAILD